MMAVVLAGGLGMRLRPYTMNIPKPLLPLGDTPTSTSSCASWSSTGSTGSCITLGHLPELVRRFLGTAARFGLASTTGRARAVRHGRAAAPGRGPRRHLPGDERRPAHDDRLPGAARLSRPRRRGHHRARPPARCPSTTAWCTPPTPAPRALRGEAHARLLRQHRVYALTAAPPTWCPPAGSTCRPDVRARRRRRRGSLPEDRRVLAGHRPLRRLPEGERRLRRDPDRFLARARPEAGVEPRSRLRGRWPRSSPDAAARCSATDLPHRDAVAAQVDRPQVLVVGGAGSIGSATVAALGSLRAGPLHVADIDENGLTELVRDLRSQRALPSRLRPCGRRRWMRAARP